LKTSKVLLETEIISPNREERKSDIRNPDLNFWSPQIAGRRDLSPHDTSESKAGLISNTYGDKTGIWHKNRCFIHE